MTDDLRPGMGADFVLYADYVKERFRVMRSTIFEMIDEKVILSQSTPALLASAMEKEILLTYLTKQEGRSVRLGFRATIVELIRDYELASQERVAAIGIRRTGATTQFDLRLHYRLKVPSDSDLKLSYDRHPLNLLDISVSGARFGFKGPVHFEATKRVPLTVAIEGRRYQVEAEVLRVWTPGVPRQGSLTFATVRFLHTGSPAERLLGESILRIQRELMVNHKRLD